MFPRNITMGANPPPKGRNRRELRPPRNQHHPTPVFFGHRPLIMLFILIVWEWAGRSIGEGDGRPAVSRAGEDAAPQRPA